MLQNTLEIETEEKKKARLKENAMGTKKKREYRTYSLSKQYSQTRAKRRKIDRRRALWKEE